jgi:hypothetical protein
MAGISAGKVIHTPAFVTTINVEILVWGPQPRGRRHESQVRADGIQGRCPESARHGSGSRIHVAALAPRREDRHRTGPLSRARTAT